MSLKFGDRIKEMSTTVGTGDFQLNGAVAKYQAFDSVCVDGDTVYYCIENQNANEWEVGIGVWNNGGVLTRQTILDSSSAGTLAGALVDFSVGLKYVFNTLPASKVPIPGGDNLSIQYNVNGVLDGIPESEYQNGTVGFKKVRFGPDPGMVVATATVFILPEDDVTNAIEILLDSTHSADIIVVDKDGTGIVYLVDGDGNLECKDIVCTGLSILGESTRVDSEVTVHDPLIELAADNPSDLLDLGFFATYVASGTKYTGLFRDATDGKYRLFSGLQTEPTTTVNIAGTGYTVATIVANVEGDLTVLNSIIFGPNTLTYSSGNLYWSNGGAIRSGFLFNGIVGCNIVGGVIWTDSASITGTRVLGLFMNSAGIADLTTGTYLGPKADLRLKNVIHVGGYELFSALSSTSVEREQGRLLSEWLESTDATRKGRIIHNVYDTSVREYMRGWADGSNGRSAISTPNSAPTDSHIANGQVSFYLDQATNELKVRVKYSDGTLKTGTIALP